MAKAKSTARVGKKTYADRIWGRGRTTMMAIVSLEERAAWKRHCKRMGMTMSGRIRALIQADLDDTAFVPDDDESAL